MPRDIRIGNAVLGFRADIREYVASLTRAEKAVRRKRLAVRRLQSQMRRTQYVINSSIRSLISFRSALATVAGGAGFGLLVKRASELGAELFENSIRTGLAVEELQTLGRVMEGDGVAAEQFSKFLIRLNQSIGAGQLGLKSYIDAFDLLDIDVTALTGVSDAVTQISDALASGNVSRSDALYALQTLGGRSGALAFNALAQGSEVIREQQKEFERLGVLTAAQAGALKTLAQTQTDAGNAIRTNAARIVAELSGLINEGLLGFIERVPAAFDALRDGIQFLVANLRSLGDALIIIGLFALRRTFIGRLALSFVAAAKAALSLRIAIASTAATFSALRALPAAATASIAAGFARIAGFARAAGVAVTGFAASAAAAAARSSLSLNSAFAAVQTGAARAGAFAGRALAVGITAGAAAAITALRTLAAAIVGVARTITRIIWPLAIIEGIIITFRYVRNLREEMDALGLSFGDVAAVAISEFAGKIINGIVRLGARVAGFYSGLAEASLTVFAAIGNNINHVFELIRVSIVNRVNAIVDRITTLAEEVENRFRQTLASVRDYFERIGRVILVTFSATFDLIRDLAGDVGEEIGQRIIDGLTGRVRTGDAARTFADIGKEAAESFSRRLREAMQQAPQSVQRIDVDVPVGGAADSAREIEKVNTQLMTLAETTDQVFADIQAGFTQFDESAEALAATLGDDVSNRLRELFGVDPETANRARTALVSAFRETRDEVRAQLRALSGDFEETDMMLPPLDTSAVETQLETIKQNFDEVADSATTAVDKVQQQSQRAADSMARSFGDAAKSAILDLSNIGDAARNLANQILNTLATRFISDPITNALTGLFGGFFGAAQHGGRHSGLTLVGEVGPELVDFRNPGRVYTSDQLRDAITSDASRGQGDIYISLNVYADNPGAFERAIAEALPSITAAVRGAIARDATQPSLLQSSLRGV